MNDRAAQRSAAILYLVDRMVERMPFATRQPFVKWVRGLPPSPDLDSRDRFFLTLLLGYLERPEPDGFQKLEAAEMGAGSDKAQTTLPPEDEVAVMVRHQIRQAADNICTPSIRDNVPASFKEYQARRAEKSLTLDNLGKELDARHEKFENLDPLNPADYPFFLTGEEPLWLAESPEGQELFMFVHLFTAFTDGGDQKTQRLQSGMRVNESLLPLVKAKGYNFRLASRVEDGERISLAIRLNQGDLLRYYVHEAGNQDVPDFHRFYEVVECTLFPIDREKYNRLLYQQKQARQQSLPDVQ